jgi:hypothetical protein
MPIPDHHKTLSQITDLLHRLARQFRDHPEPEDPDARRAYRSQSQIACSRAGFDLASAWRALLNRLDSAEREALASSKRCTKAQGVIAKLKVENQRLGKRLLHYQAIERARVREAVEDALLGDVTAEE